MFSQLNAKNQAREGGALTQQCQSAVYISLSSHWSLEADSDEIIERLLCQLQCRLYELMAIGYAWATVIGFICRCIPPSSEFLITCLLRSIGRALEELTLSSLASRSL